MDKTRVYLTESLSTKEKKEKQRGSILAIIIMIMGYLLILGGVAASGYLIFTVTEYGILKITLICLSCIFAGVLIIGFARIINLLEEINRKV